LSSTVKPQNESASLRTFRQLLSGEDIIQLTIRLGLLAILIYWTFLLIRPFVPILAWSVVLAVALYPVFARLAGLLGGRPRLAATILTVISLGIIVGPATWVGLSAVEGVRVVAAQLSTGDLTVPSPPDSVKEWPFLGMPLYEFWSRASENLRAVLHEIATYLKPLAGTMIGLASNAGIGTLKFLISVGVAGALFVHGPQLATATRSFLSHVVPERSEYFLQLAAATIRAVSQGVIGVAVLQSLLAGIGLKLAGIPGAGLLALAVLVLVIIQVGTAIVLFPVIIWVWAAKDFTTALPLTLFLVVVGVLDNVLKPLVMARGLTTPTPVIFIGVVGGTLAHGIVGLFIGPIVLAVAWELMAAWIREDRSNTAPVAEHSPES
jgi:predicted PurR-regulated permease PerM